MKVQIVANGKVSVVISPENTMEEEALKQLMRQDNELTEIRNGVTVLGSQYNQGIMIAPKIKTALEDSPESKEQNSDEAKEEDL